MLALSEKRSLVPDDMRLEGQERDIWNWFVAVKVNLAALGIKEYFLEDTIIMCVALMLLSHHVITSGSCLDS